MKETATDVSFTMQQAQDTATTEELWCTDRKTGRQADRQTDRQLEGLHLFSYSLTDRSYHHY